jgi:hypothetical protein
MRTLFSPSFLYYSNKNSNASPLVELNPRCGWIFRIKVEVMGTYHDVIFDNFATGQKKVLFIHAHKFICVYLIGLRPLAKLAILCL